MAALNIGATQQKAFEMNEKEHNMVGYKVMPNFLELVTDRTFSIYILIRKNDRFMKHPNVPSLKFIA